MYSSLLCCGELAFSEMYFHAFLGYSCRNSAYMCLHVCEESLSLMSLSFNKVSNQGLSLQISLCLGNLCTKQRLLLVF